MRQQLLSLEKFALDNGYKVLKIFKDEAKTATKMLGREGLYAAMEFIESLKHIDREKNEVALLVLDTDRLARNEEDHFGLMGFFSKHKVKLISKNQPGINDSAEGRLMDTVMAGVNAFQSRMIGRKVSGVKQRLAEEGRTTYKSPLGYRNVNIGTEEKPNRTVQIDPDASGHIQEMFRLCATGAYTLKGIADELNQKGVRTKQGKPLSRGVIEKYLTNPYFIGKIKCKGEIKDGKHPRLIDDDLFEKCKAMLTKNIHGASRKRKPENHAKFFLKDYLRCGVCDYLITGETSTGKRQKKYDYYRCIRPKEDAKWHSNECAKMHEIEKAVEVFFSMIRLSQGIVDEALQRARDVLSDTQDRVDGRVKRLHKEIEKLNQRNISFALRWADKEVPNDVYFQVKEITDSELAKANAELKEIEGVRKDNTKLFESFVRLAHDLPKAYRQSSPEVKKMYLQIFWECFEIDKREIAKANPSKIVKALLAEKLITLKATTPEAKVLISRVWQPHGESNPAFLDENQVS